MAGQRSVTSFNNNSNSNNSSNVGNPNANHVPQSTLTSMAAGSGNAANMGPNSHMLSAHMQQTSSTASTAHAHANAQATRANNGNTNSGNNNVAAGSVPPQNATRPVSTTNSAGGTSSATAATTAAVPSKKGLGHSIRYRYGHIHIHMYMYMHTSAHVCVFASLCPFMSARCISLRT